MVVTRAGGRVTRVALVVWGALALALGGCDGDGGDGTGPAVDAAVGGAVDGALDAAPSPDGPEALPTERIDGAGNVWDIQPDGALNQGNFDTYEGYPTFSDAAWLTLDGQRAPAVPVARQALDGRELVLGPSPIAGLELTRPAITTAAARMCGVSASRGPLAARRA